MGDLVMPEVWVMPLMPKGDSNTSNAVTGQHGFVGLHCLESWVHPHLAALT